MAIALCAVAAWKESNPMKDATKMPTHEPSQKSSRGMGLVVVSEDPVMRDLLSVIGKRHGFEVSATTAPDEAAAAIDDRRTTMAIVDPRAWGAEGGAIVGRLCAQGRGTKVMVLVDRAGPLIPAEVKKAGAIAVLPYPLDSQGLDTVLDLLCHGSDQGSAAGGA